MPQAVLGLEQRGLELEVGEEMERKKWLQEMERKNWLQEMVTQVQLED
jgi:hypothetical protein